MATRAQKLLLRTEDGAPHECEVRAGEPFVIGRGREAHLRLDFKSVSRQHCRLELDPATGKVELVDLGSQNGTRLNGKRIDRAALRAGDAFMVATVPLRVESVGGQTAPPPAPSARSGRLPVAGPSPAAPPAPAPRPDGRDRDRRILDQLEALGLDVIERVDAGSPVQSFRAHRRNLDQVVLVKAVQVDEIAGPGDRGARLLREAKLAAKVRHKNIVQVFDVRESAGIVAIIYEWAPGKPLAHEIQRLGRIETTRALEIGMQLCDALEHAHAHGVVHRNITPGSVIVSEAGEVKLVDFGLAKSMTQAGKSEMQLTGSREGLGAVEYAPPEQVRDGRDADHRADIYSVGSTLYHALAGEPPLIVINPARVDDPLADVPAPITDVAPNVPEAARAVIERAMRARRDQRYQSAAEMRDALASALAGIAPGAARGAGESARLRTGFVGRIQPDELIALLQMIEHNRKSGYLDMHGAPDAGGRRVSGSVVFREGEVVEAQAGEHRGVEALHELFLLPSGNFRVVFGDVAASATEDQQLPLHISVTIMELLRRKDETARTRPKP